MPLQIDAETFAALKFDFADALAVYTAAMAEHAATTGVPAPSAHSLVEAAYRAGGYTVDGDPIVTEPGARYVPLATVRERLEAHDPPLWSAAVDALVAGGGTALLAKVLSLREGLSPEDPQVLAILTAIGADAAEILA